MQRLLCALMLTLFLSLAAGACSNPGDVARVESAPVQTRSASKDGEEPSPDAATLSLGGGDPRGVGYWLLWNSCAPENQAEVAAANGGREAGWIIMDDLLADPGIRMGEMPLQSCEQGLRLLQGQDLDGTDRGESALYQMARQLLAEQLNVAAGAEYCPAVEDTVLEAQALLVDARFDGKGGAADLSGNIAAELPRYNDLLGQYNIGALCR